MHQLQTAVSIGAAASSAFTYVQASQLESQENQIIAYTVASAIIAEYLMWYRPPLRPSRSAIIA